MSAARPARVGIVGCGNVTDMYLEGCAPLPAIELAACADLDADRAAALSAKGGFPAQGIEALMADPTIEIVLNLTPPTAHAGVSRAAIAAGKHVYSEKPLATTLDDGRAILADAEAAGVRIGGAPDTFLGGGLQTARALIDAGAIGQALVASAAVLHLGPERWHPNPAFFYGPGGGPLLDVGPYYVTALIGLLGPVVEVSALARGAGDERLIAKGSNAGQWFTSTAPTSVVASYAFESGAVGGFTASFDVVASDVPHIEIHGTEGSLNLGDSNEFDGHVRLRRIDAPAWEDVPLAFDGTVGRGIGLADMIGAIREGRPHRASGAFAYHVLEVLLATEQAAATSRTVVIQSRSPRPEALPAPG